MCDIIFDGDDEIESKNQLKHLVGSFIYDCDGIEGETCLCDVDIESVLNKANINFKKDPAWGYEIIRKEHHGKINT